MTGGLVDGRKMRTGEVVTIAAFFVTVAAGWVGFRQQVLDFEASTEDQIERIERDQSLLEDRLRSVELLLERVDERLGAVHRVVVEGRD